MVGKVQLIEEAPMYVVLTFMNSEDIEPKYRTSFPYNQNDQQFQHKEALEYGKLSALSLEINLEDLTKTP